MDYTQLCAAVEKLKHDRAGCCGDESGSDANEVARLRATLRMMSQVRAGKQRVGDDIDAAATACQRHAKEELDAVDKAAQTTDNDLDRGMKAGKIPMPMPGKPLTRDSLWYRWKKFYGDWLAYLSSVTGEGGTGVNSMNCEVVSTNAKQWMVRLQGFRTEIGGAMGGDVTPVGPLPDQPPSTIPDLPTMGGPVLGGVAALALVLLLRR